MKSQLLSNIQEAVKDFVEAKNNEVKEYLRQLTINACASEENEVVQPQDAVFDNFRNDEKQPDLGKPRFPSIVKEDNPNRVAARNADGDMEVFYRISKDKRVTISRWAEQDVLLVQIREYYRDRAGEECPGKKGIALTVGQWKELVKVIQDVD